MTDGAVLLWCFSTGESLVSCAAMPATRTFIAWRPARLTTVRQMHRKTRRSLFGTWIVAKIRELDASPATPTALAFSPDGKQIAANGGCAYGAVLWDAVSGKKDIVIGDPSQDIGAIAFSAAGTEIATGSNDGRTITIWDRKTGSKLRTLRPTEATK